MGEGEKKPHGTDAARGKANETEQRACTINNITGPVTVNHNNGGRESDSRRDFDELDRRYRRKRGPHLRRVLVVAAATSALSVSAVALSAVGHGVPTPPGSSTTTPAPVTQPQQPLPPAPTTPIGNPGHLASFVETKGLPFQAQMQADGTMQLTASKTDVAPNGDAGVSFRIHESNGNTPRIVDQSGVSCNGCSQVIDGQKQFMQVGDVRNGGEVDFLISWKPTMKGHAQLQVRANGNPNWECIGNINEGRSGPGA